MELISSTQNPTIKNVVKLIEKASERKAQDLIVIEGEREIKLAVDSGFEIISLFVCSALRKEETIEFLNRQVETPDATQVTEVSKEVFSKIAYRENSDGLVALAKPKQLSLAEIKLSKTPLVIVLEAVEKPGNLGAILRTADAAQVDAVIICDPKTDIYNPNVIRASIGTLFTNQVSVASNDEVLDWLKKNKIMPFAAALTAKKNYTEANLNSSCAIVMGTEADGLSEKWLNTAEQIKIPMQGKIDSLNVSTSCAVIVFEALRQRNK